MGRWGGETRIFIFSLSQHINAVHIFYCGKSSDLFVIEKNNPSAVKSSHKSFLHGTMTCHELAPVIGKR